MMEQDYEDYKDFVDNPPRLIACPPDNVTLPSDMGGPDGYCVQPFVLDGSRQTVAIYGIVSPLFVAMTLITNCLVCVVLLKPTMRTCTNALLVAMAVSDTMTGVSETVSITGGLSINQSFNHLGSKAPH